MRLVPEKYKDPTKETTLVTEALDRLRALPGVEAAAITRRVPLNDNCVIGTDLSTDLSSTPVHLMYECIDVGPDYFRAIGIALLRVRDFCVYRGVKCTVTILRHEVYAFGHAFSYGDNECVFGLDRQDVPIAPVNVQPCFQRGGALTYQRRHQD